MTKRRKEFFYFWLLFLHLPCSVLPKYVAICNAGAATVDTRDLLQKVLLNLKLTNMDAALKEACLKIPPLARFSKSGDALDS